MGALDIVSLLMDHPKKKKKKKFYVTHVSTLARWLFYHVNVDKLEKSMKK
jgi:hypothetical protein